MSERYLPEALADLPPSCKLIHRVLDDVGEATLAELRAETALPDRTCRDALERLEDADLVGSRPYLRDARQTIYYLED